MSYRNGVRVDSQQLRDIQDLISKLEDVNKQLALPLHAVPLSQVMESETADAASLDRGSCRRVTPARYPRAMARSSRADAEADSAAERSWPNVRR